MSLAKISAQEKSQFKLISKRIAENVYLITSNNKVNVTHVGVVVGSDGLLLVDSYFESTVEELYRAIRDISDKPIKYVVNTHSHPDHSGGNKFFADKGATIVSQNNSQYSDAYGQLRFKDTIKLDLGNEVLHATHVISHTYDDAIIYLEKSNMIFMGDNLSTHTFLSIGEKGLEGHLAAFDLALSLSNDSTIVVPAHAAFNDEGSSTLVTQDLNSYKDKFSAWVKRLKQLRNNDISVGNMISDPQLRQLTLDIATDGHKDTGRRMLAGPGFEQIVDIAVKSIFAKKHNLPDETLNKYIGNYRSASGIITEIYNEKGKLHIRESGKFIAELLPLGKQTFLIKGYFFGIGNGKETIEFDFNRFGEVEALTPILNKSSVWKTEMNTEIRLKI